jgi:pyruvate formate lyase activating enzyme
MWFKAPSGDIICRLCFRGCRTAIGQRGFCRVRLNRDGQLITLNYGHTGAISLDPVEKKPLYHFRPGSLTLSIGAPGCNLACLGCQNYHLSRPDLDWPGESPPGDIVSRLAALALEQGADSWAFTYSEPTVFYEYALDLGARAAQDGQPVIWVTNGSMNTAILESLSLSAMNIDLKAFTQDFYSRITQGSLVQVKSNIEKALYLGIWVEVTTLLIPGLNDSETELKNLTRYLASLSPDLPWHVSRFFPRYRQNDLEPTPVASLIKAREIGRSAGLKYVYLGNLQGPNFSDTFCPNCRKLLVARQGYCISENHLSSDGLCPSCGTHIPGRWN